MIWIVVPKEPAPDAPYWPGRGWLAALDAIGWPVAGMLGLLQVRLATGIVFPVAIALLAMAALLRLRTALWLNHRYRFTTWLALRAAFVLLVVGLVMKVAMR